MSEVVGSGAKHSSNVKEGMRRANEMREQWIRSLQQGEIPFPRVVELSKTEEYKPLSTIRLSQLLSKRPGWTEATAYEAMSHQGFQSKDTIKSIRRSDRKVELFDVLMKADSDRWRPRPYMPEGWPWFGKLTELFEHNDIERPSELTEILGEADESSTGDETNDIDDVFAALMEDEDD